MKSSRPSARVAWGRFGRRAIHGWTGLSRLRLHLRGSAIALRAKHEPSPPDSSRKLLDIAVQISEGMAAAHAAGIVHRDLKPDNILMTREGRVKILDFGLAKAAHQEIGPEDATIAAPENLTDPGTTIGTIAYMSPEQARGDVNLTAQSDQFSLGLVLYELAAGKRAFQRSSAAEIMAAIIREDAAPLPASAPAPFRWIVERLLLYGIRAEGEHQYLFSLAIATGQMKTIGDVGSEFAPRSYLNPGIRFSVSPDGGSILYPTASTKRGLWMLEGFEKP